MNGNDYLEIEETHIQTITEDYIEALRQNLQCVPSKFIIRWIDLYLEGGR